MTEPEHQSLADMLATCDNPHALIVVDDDTRAAPSAPGATSTPVPTQPRTRTPSPATTTYASCDDAHAAREVRLPGAISLSEKHGCRAIVGMMGSASS